MGHDGGSQIAVGLIEQTPRNTLVQILRDVFAVGDQPKVDGVPFSWKQICFCIYLMRDSYGYRFGNKMPVRGMMAIAMFRTKSPWFWCEQIPRNMLVRILRDAVDVVPYGIAVGLELQISRFKIDSISRAIRESPLQSRFCFGVHMPRNTYIRDKMYAPKFVSCP